MPTRKSGAPSTIDLNALAKALAGPGVDGWIHGSVGGQGLYAFTYRDPSNFFDYIIMSLVSFDPGVQKQFESFGRNDEVLVKGSFMDNPSPQKHIAVTSIALVKKYQPAYSAGPYAYEARIPDDLLNLSSATFLVHGVFGNGQILVVEYKDAILPVFVQNGALTANLYRGDLVELQFKIQSAPNRPTHLNLLETAPQPVKVLDAIAAQNGQPITIQGALILFPKSPEITLNVFAVQQKLPAGLSRQFTLANLTDPNIFAQITAKLQAAWDKYPGAYVNGRNKLLSTKLQVKVTGTFNETDPGQANAQVLLDSADAIQVIEQP